MARQQVELGSDGLPVLVQGSWSRDKLFFVAYFAALFSGGMKRLWPTRAYVDLFAGPGLCKDKVTGQEFQGSPLQALDCRTPFTQYYFNDIEPELIAALKTRQERLFPDANVTYSSLDCNIAAVQIRGKLPRNALVLAFVDPWTYEIEFEGLASLVRGRSIDLIITFHTTAIKRNVRHQIDAVDKFLDDSNWRSRFWLSAGDLSNPRTLVLIDTFRGQLRRQLGYTFFGDPQVIRNTKGAPIFYLLFASRHRRGLDFWEKSSARLRGGQRTLF